MKYKNIYFPTSLSEVDPSDDNIDVIITLEDDSSYVLVVATPINLVSLMKKENKSYLSAGCPFAFVEELTEENIMKLVVSFCETDAYWLKYYHKAGERD
ncbi:MAG: hypothetical protein LBK75_10065 [Oscillospiraceae bacterium]|jgi:hypothetical protein|nr:hypothetical protein [Oscillospiraceae bacterium]